MLCKGMREGHSHLKKSQVFKSTNWILTKKCHDQRVGLFFIFLKYVPEFTLYIVWLLCCRSLTQSEWSSLRFHKECIPCCTLQNPSSSTMSSRKSTQKLVKTCYALCPPSVNRDLKKGCWIWYYYVTMWMQCKKGHAPMTSWWKLAEYTVDTRL